MNNVFSPILTLYWHLQAVQAVGLCGAGQCTFVHVQSPGRLRRTHTYTGVCMQAYEYVTTVYSWVVVSTVWSNLEMLGLQLQLPLSLGLLWHWLKGLKLCTFGLLLGCQCADTVHHTHGLQFFVMGWVRTYWILSCQWSTQHSENVPFLFNIECHCIQYSTYCICCLPKVCLAVYQVYCYCSLWNLIHCKVLNLQPNTECYVHFMNVTISSPSSKLHHLSKILKWTEQANPFDILVCTFYTETTRWRPYKHFRPWSKALYLYLGGLLMNSNLMLYSPLGRGSWGYGGRGVCYLLLALPWDPDAPPPTRTPGACLSVMLLMQPELILLWRLFHFNYIQCLLTS